MWLAGLVFLLLAAAFIVYVWSEKEIDRANDLRHQSFLLADELRQTSDDLTRMARTYTVTTQARYRNAYDTIVGIRDGKLPRPASYASIYWDTVLLQDEPAATQVKRPAALLNLMREAEFTPQELDDLARAKQQSDALIGTERSAMDLAASGEPEKMALARAMLHDDAYHAAKAAIMQPIAQVYASMDARTVERVAHATRQAMYFRIAFVAVAVALMLIAFGALHRLTQLLGGSADRVYGHLTRIGRGDFSADIKVAQKHKNSVLGWLAQTLLSLRTMQSERERERAVLMESEAKLNSIIQAEPECIKIVDAQGRLELMNPAGLAMIEADALQQVAGAPVAKLIAPEYQAAFAAMHQRVLAGESVEMQFEIIGLHGARRWMQTHAVPLQYGGRTVHLALTRDITDQMNARNEIEQLAFYDSLTGLPNRHLLMDRLTQALAGVKRKATHGALMLLDLDNFKVINDTLGHLVGDRLLIEVAARLKSCMREGDTVARFGGDEFVIILQGLEPTGMAALQAEAVASKLLERLSAPVSLEITQAEGKVELRTHYCSASMGVTLFVDDSVNSTELLKRADTAMYQAKAAGRNAMRFFDADIQSKVSEHAILEADLHTAVQQRQFVVYYQPQVAVDGRLAGAEALVRWQHPQRGLLLPGLFISVAEETGIILDIGQWVMESACAQLALWAAKPGFGQLTIAVNVSALQFKQENFVGQVLATLDASGARPERLKLELTESMLVDDVDSMIEKMTALKAHGVGFSLDDFGTGYSSLYHLKRLPLDQLKIDQSFVKNIVTDTNDASIARMVMALAESLGLGVIAEGVEHPEQADFLRAMGCHAYQGYLYGWPMPVAELEKQAHIS
ncbi:MAG: GGDEF domain-containing protein [Comamonadaceae bacterium CG_4_9_14_0_8_um_filter_60_18]|nr:MAG: GGDEF domain-containing protein [Comamonadaceae bacterium CG_4_9_14_0_8_um_filter_60_18]